MFVYDNGKMCVYSATRCGHTSMYGYFNIPVYTCVAESFNIWQTTKNLRIVVLRNPYQRLISAYKRFGCNSIIYDEHARQQFIEHSRPFLKYICYGNTMNFVHYDIETGQWRQNYLDFCYINFDRLSEYIPTDNRTITTNTKSESKVYVKNDVYSENDLETEYIHYENLLATKREITPEEWKELTQ